MALVPATFRATFPEFSDPGIYTDAVLEFWDGIAQTFMDPVRWGTAFTYGESLFVAHHLAVAARDQATSDAGGIPGTVQGPIASKSIDKVSVSYDAAAVSITDADFWNMSSYGIRFQRLAKMMGAGALQL